MTEQEIADAEAVVLASLSSPQSVTTDAGTVTMPSLSSQLELLKHIKSDVSQSSSTLKFQQFKHRSTQG